MDLAPRFRKFGRMKSLVKPGISSRVATSQTDIHPKLRRLHAQYQQAAFNKPASEHTRRAFARAEELARTQGRPLILDSGCGVGESTVALAKAFPDHLVLGIDKSVARLNKHHAYRDLQIQNYALLRADLVDFWRLAAAHQWQVERHYILYPNPWPKKEAVKKRWHGHPVFADLLKLGKYLELRSNWRIYVEEFAYAVFLCTGRKFEVTSYAPAPPITPFERKYLASQQEFYRLVMS